MHPFLSAWRNYQPTQPFLLPGDESLAEGATARFSGWERYTHDPNFGSHGGSKLHLDLLPMPFVGNLERAKVYLLMLNPGLAPSDYYGEYNVQEYRSALQNNLAQRPDSTFFFLDPTFSWHGGYLYWHSKLSKLIASVAHDMEIQYGEARRIFQEHLAVLELLPYHSATFGIAGKKLEKLKSVALARSFVLETLVPKAQAGKCLIVATRAKGYWRLPEHENIITYSGGEARGAHLSASTRGGKAISSFLRRAARAA
jgi:hypothetical protein